MIILMRSPRPRPRLLPRRALLSLSVAGKHVSLPCACALALPSRDTGLGVHPAACQPGTFYTP